MQCFHSSCKGCNRLGTSMCPENSFLPTKIRKRQKTNADCIRCATDDELADILGSSAVCPTLFMINGGIKCGKTCLECWKSWLRSEATRNILLSGADSQRNTLLEVAYSD